MRFKLRLITIVIIVMLIPGAIASISSAKRAEQISRTELAITLRQIDTVYQSAAYSDAPREDISASKPQLQELKEDVESSVSYLAGEYDAPIRILILIIALLFVHTFLAYDPNREKPTQVPHIQAQP